MFNLAVKKNFEKNLPLKVYGNLKSLTVHRLNQKCFLVISFPGKRVVLIRTT